jgi:hypothetical protein
MGLEQLCCVCAFRSAWPGIPAFHSAFSYAHLLSPCCLAQLSFLI